MNDQAELIDLLTSVPTIRRTLDVLSDYGIPNHYLAGGVITQCFWNLRLGNDPLYKVKDLDVIYFNRESVAIEKVHQRKLNHILGGNLPLEVKNQANLHLWYGTKFGNDIQPLTEVEDGIRMWLSAFAIGIRKQGAGYKVFAPYGLADLATFSVRPNKLAMSKSNYEMMTNSFKERWPQINVEPW